MDVSDISWVPVSRAGARGDLPAQSVGVHLYFADLDDFSQQMSLADTLDEAERRRSRTISDPRQRERFIVARGLTREQLAHYTGRAADSLQFEILTHGKPSLVPQLPRFSFNVSHTGPFWLLGVSSTREMGVDLERIRPVRDLTRLARRVFSDLEQEELIAINDQAEKERAFFRGWTRKEAVLKALGTGFSFSPRRLHVGLMEANVLSCQLDSVETLQVHSGMISNNLFWSVAIPSVTNSLSKFRLLGKDRDSLD